MPEGAQSMNNPSFDPTHPRAHRRLRRALGLGVLAALVMALGSTTSAEALTLTPRQGISTASTAPTAPTAPTAGWTVTHNREGELATSPATPASTSEAVAFLTSHAALAATATSVSSCFHGETCLTIGSTYNTGLTKYMHGPGTVSCPCYYVPVYKRSFTSCHGFEALSVEACMNGQIIFVPGYAACGTVCTISGLRGYHNCGVPHTGSFGWSIDQVDCSDSYLSSHATVFRNSMQNCFVRVTLCDTNSFHVNTYPSGSITGPYTGLGAYS